MPLNPKRAFNAMLEGPLRTNDDGMPALYDGDEELTYWDEGQPIEVQLDGDWVKGAVGWDGNRYAVDLPDGRQVPLDGLTARRRVGGSV